MSRSSLLGGIFGVRWKEGRRSITVAIFCVISPPSTCSHSGNVCRRVRAERRAPITCFSQDDSSVCGKALHPLLSHSPIPSRPHPPPPAPPIFPSERKNRTAGGGNYRTARRRGRASILFLFYPKKHFLGSVVVSSSLPPPAASGRTAGDGWDDAKGAL